METSSDASTGERLGSGVLGASGHQTGHLILSELDLTTTEGREGLVTGTRVSCVLTWTLRESSGALNSMKTVVGGTYDIGDLVLEGGGRHCERCRFCEASISSIFRNW